MKMRRNVFVLVMVCLVCVFTVSLPQAVSAASVNMEAAKKIALDHAGADAANVTFTKVEFDRGRNRSEYEIDFTWNNIRYEYEIDADSGEIREYSQKEPRQSRGNGGNTADAGNAGNYIGTEAAKAAALEHAGISAAQADFSKVKLDRNRRRGTAEYEIDFFADGKKYEYEVDASSGEILEYSVETRNNRR